MKEGKYNITLVNLILPNNSIFDTVPYIFVDFHSKNAKPKDVFVSNNKFLEDMAFKCMITSRGDKFTHFKALNSCQLNLIFNYGFVVRVVLPNGDVLRNVECDCLPPRLPNTDLQMNITLLLNKFD